MYNEPIEKLSLQCIPFSAKTEVSDMKSEYEVTVEVYNACAGEGRPQTYFEVVQLENTDEYVKMKHGKDFENMAKEILPSGEIQYCLDTGSVKYKYIFSE